MPRLTLLPRAGHPNNRAGDAPRARAFTVDVPAGINILDAASDNGFLIATRCGGIADCKTCRVEVDEGFEGALSEMQYDEKVALDEVVDRSPRARLSCQARLLADVTVFVPDPAAMEDE
jgi:2Fe-2S ferredoxin